VVVHVVCTAGTGGADDLCDEFGHFHFDVEFQKVSDWMECKVSASVREVLAYKEPILTPSYFVRT
jgi:hypothetical protein